MKICFNSYDTRHKSPFGTLTPLAPCRIALFDADREACAATLVMHNETGFYMELPLRKEKDGFCNTFYLFETGLYFYHFRVSCGNEPVQIYRSGRDTCAESGCEWEISCCNSAGKAWKEWAGRPMYQIFPDRFAKAGECDLRDKLRPFTVHEDVREVPALCADPQGNWNTDFYGGNLQGIRSKLPYLKELGMEILYLNPIFMAHSNHRYDTADYLRVDPMLGNDADFRELCNAAHELGMRILLDGVFSHTGSNSVYFDEKKIFGHGVCSDPESPYRSWYSFSGDGQYDCWWGIKTLPCVKEMEESYLSFLLEGEGSVVAHWLRAGADGFRLDVADELPDAFLERFHAAVKAIKPDALILGEVWEDASDKISYGVRRRYFTSRELDSVMNYPYRSAIIDFVKGDDSARGTADRILEIASHYPEHALHCSMVPLSTHDTVRILSLMGPHFSGSRQEKAAHCLTGPDYLEAVQKLRTALFLQFMLPGIPCVYYGDEAGMQGWEDPLNRRFFDWEHIDRNLHDYVASLAKLRGETAVLRTGMIRLISDEGNRIVMEREGDFSLRFAVNMDEEPMSVPHRQILFSENCDQSNPALVYKYGGICYLP